RRGGPFSGERRRMVYGAIEERLPWLFEDDRIFEAVEQLLGSHFVWIASDSNLYVGDTGWHPDSGSSPFEMGYDSLKIAVYLDPVDRNSGCLRVIPGSHRDPFHQTLVPMKERRN